MRFAVTPKQGRAEVAAGVEGGRRMMTNNDDDDKEEDEEEVTLMANDVQHSRSPGTVRKRAHVPTGVRFHDNSRTVRISYLHGRNEKCWPQQIVHPNTDKTNVKNYSPTSFIEHAGGFGQAQFPRSPLTIRSSFAHNDIINVSSIC
jgi:hypothetical protein